jgi:uncharacterized membrane protein
MDSITSYGQPGLPRVMISLATWFTIAIAFVIVRLETAYWANMVIVTVIVPLLVYYLGSNSIILSLSVPSAMIVVTVAILSLVTLTEGFKLRKLRTYFKEYGKNMRDTTITTLIVTTALMFGLTVAYLISGGELIDFD